jgi:hypothetical protein
MNDLLKKTEPSFLEAKREAAAEALVPDKNQET